MIQPTSLHTLERNITLTQDFPETGILFRDISPLLEHHFPSVINSLAEKIQNNINTIDCFGGIDARGFIFAGALAQKFNKGMLMIRKDGKLPPPVETIEYDIEYGSRKLALSRGNGRVLLVDDVIATGGSLKAAADLCQKCGYDVKGFLSLIDLAYLNDFNWNGMKADSVLRYTQQNQILYPHPEI